MNKLLLLFFTVITLCLQAQKLTYDVYLFGKKIGNMYVTKTVAADSSITYLLQSSSVATVMFITRRSSQNYLVTYKNGMLVKVDAVNYVNDETKTTKIVWNINKYIVNLNGKYSYINKPVINSLLLCYFKEPALGTTIFSERMAEYFTIKKDEEGLIEYTLSDGVRNRFHYKNGVPDFIELKKSFITVEVKLVKVEQ